MNTPIAFAPTARETSPLSSATSDFLESGCPVETLLPQICSAANDLALRGWSLQDAINIIIAVPGVCVLSRQDLIWLIRNAFACASARSAINHPSCKNSLTPMPFLS